MYNIIKFLNLEDYLDVIDSIDSFTKNNIIYCPLTLKRQKEICPACGFNELSIHSYYVKKIAHSVSTNSKCFLLYNARRYKCKFCNKVFYEKNPFSDGKDQISTYTIMIVLDALRNCNATFTSVASQFNLTKQQVIFIFDSYVACNRKKFTEVICIDEVYTSKVSKYKYACVILDFKSWEIIEVYNTRRMDYLANRFTVIPEIERNNVKYAVIDMWETYRDLIKRYFKKAIIAVDSFHIIKNLNDLMNKIRIRIMNKYNKKTNKLTANDMYYYMLKKYHYFFTKNYEDIYSGDIRIHKIKAKWRKNEILKYLLSIDDELKYAYYLKEKYREFNLSATVDTCKSELETLIYEFSNCHIEEYREFGKLLINWKNEIINSFIRIEGRRLSNSAIENVNSKIKTIIRNANGYSNFNRLRNRIMFSINKKTPIKGVPNKPKTK